MVRRQLYCGNNRLNPDVVAGRKRIGDRYSCLKKGIGVGVNLPYDPTYNLPYEPIDQTIIYCGRGRLPAGYTRPGNNPQCLMKGVAVGKKIRARRGR